MRKRLAGLRGLCGLAAGRPGLLFLPGLNHGLAAVCRGGNFAKGSDISAASVRRIEIRPPADALPPLLPPVELPSAEMVPEPESEAVLR